MTCYDDFLFLFSRSSSSVFVCLSCLVLVCSLISSLDIYDEGVVSCSFIVLFLLHDIDDCWRGSCSGFLD